MIEPMGKKKFKKSVAPVEETSSSKKGFPYKIFLIAAVVIAVISFLSITGILVYKTPYIQELLGKRSTDATDVASVVDEVSEVVLLPSDEEPTFATVSDVTKLSDQEFFNNAENGDIVLIYEKAKKAFLYRPSVRQLIEIGPVTTQEGEAAVAGAETSVSPTSTEPARVLLRNGTSVSGLTRSIETQLGQKGIEFELAGRENASRNDYEQTIVVDVSGTQSAMAQELAKALGASVGSLPEGENTPTNSDILVILGQTSAEAQ